MLAHNTNGVTVPPVSETLICDWIADGSKYLIGFTGTGTYSAEFRLYVENGGVEECWYVYNTSPGNRTAYIADRGTKLPAGTKVSLKVIHEDSYDQQFKGTILGGD
jgi:hypothetical protein